MEKIFENGSAKGISDALYEIAWNERERKAKPEIYQKKYFQALKFAILFQQREFAIFLQNDLNEIEYTLNIGEACENISKLQKSFHETSKTNSVLEHINRKNKIVFYDEIGFTAC